ncbi:CaiB/BaiF CoA transferase family protein [Fodinibius saliphilus]|uniref:CaiB/BaiF CoA transferase family protein n=1 Tax=Fodinibius saliphilus TaxID=1920650 RepID=UPI0011080C6B|nr:CoA transferase [Fodinibius saliphilus]
MESVFEELKIIELASVLAGPAVGNFFSELGANVIKVENKRSGGDITREWRQPGETHAGPSAYYASVNWDKEVRFLDLGKSKDKKQVKELVSEADIVISNFKKGDPEKFGFTYEDVKKLNSSIIYGHISGFGSESDRLAYDLILQAETGFMSMNGQPESPPTKMPLALIDVLAAHQLKEGILCAMLKQRDDANQSFKVEVSLYDSAVASLINQSTNWLMNGNVPQQIGSLHPNIAPYGEVFTTKENCLVTFAIGSNRQFRDLCRVLKAKSLLQEKEFQGNASRVNNREALAQKIQEKVAGLECELLLNRCRKQHVPAAKIKNMKQVFESDQAQSLLLKEDIEGRETIRPKTTVFNIIK